MGYKPGEKGGGENHAIWTTPLGPELKQKYQGYEVKQYNIIMNVLGGWFRDLEVRLKELVESKSKAVFFYNMQNSVLSGH